MTTPSDPKAALRRVLHASRPEPESQASQSAAICDALRAWFTRQPVGIIASFAALPGEPRLLPLLADLPDRRWVFPRVSGHAMGFHFAEAAGFRAGMFGIEEPPADAPACPIGDIAVFLCPGMAFTPVGERIGRGKGYYDRTLAISRPGSIRIGVCFREQVLPDLPTDSHDLRMHFLATPAGVSSCA